MARRRNEQVDWRQGKPIFVVLGVLFAISIATGLLAILLSPKPDDTVALTCVDNLKRLTIAVKAYAEDHENLLPPVRRPVPLAEVSAHSLEYAPDAARVWAQGDWRRLVLPYVTSSAVFVCPVTESAYSYELNSPPEGLDTALISDPLNYALLWDVGLRDKPGEGPHKGKYAVNTLGNTGFVTGGRGELFGKLLFRP